MFIVLEILSDQVSNNCPALFIVITLICLSKSGGVNIHCLETIVSLKLFDKSLVFGLCLIDRTLMSLFDSLFVRGLKENNKLLHNKADSDMSLNF